MVVSVLKPKVERYLKFTTTLIERAYFPHFSVTKPGCRFHQCIENYLEIEC